MERLDDGRPCGETFTVVSRGCFRHPYIDGYNQGVKSGEVSNNKHMKDWSPDTSTITEDDEQEEEVEPQAMKQRGKRGAAKRNSPGRKKVEN